MLPHSKRRAPATCNALAGSSNLGNRRFERHVAVGWQVAVDFEPNADFNQNRCRPGHGVLPLDLRKVHRAVVQTISPTSNSAISDRKKRFRGEIGGRKSFPHRFWELRQRGPPPRVSDLAARKVSVINWVSRWRIHAWHRSSEESGRLEEISPLLGCRHRRLMDWFGVQADCPAW